MTEELSDICKGTLYGKIGDRTYCVPGLRTKIRCKYQTWEKDSSGLYGCVNTPYKIKYENKK